MKFTVGLGRRCLLPAVVFVLALPVAVVAQACPNGRIAQIFVNNESVFDTSEMTEGDRLLWLYDFANWMHMGTREDFIAAELLFEVGDCLNEELLAESERLLRNLIFIASAQVFPVTLPNGSVHVVVNTRDEWTLQFSLRARFEEGFEFTGVDVEEENLLGRGIGLEAFLQQRREQRLVGGSLTTERFLGTRLNAGIRAGETRVGPFLAQSIHYPFVGEVGHNAMVQSFSKFEDLFAYSLNDDPTYSHVVIPIVREEFEISYAHRLGRPGALTVIGGGLSVERLDTDADGEGVSIVQNKNFAVREPAPAPYVDPVLGQITTLEAGRINLILARRQIAFITRRGLDALRGVQDVATGWEAALTVGKSLSQITPGTRTRETSDHYVRGRVFAGWTPGDFVVNASAGLEGRRVTESTVEATGWRDVLGSFDLVTYWKAGPEARHTVVGRVTAGGGWHTDMPFQLTLGGVRGIRGYSLDSFSGGRRFVASLEDRVYFGSPLGQAFDLGMTFFGDVGRMWAGDAPFGSDTDWLASVGAGLRIGFPAGSRSVFRVDVATPANGPNAFDGITFRVSVGETLGLRSGFRDPQLVRSRRNWAGEALLPNPVTGR